MGILNERLPNPLHWSRLVHRQPFYVVNESYHPINISRRKTINRIRKRLCGIAFRNVCSSTYLQCIVIPPFIVGRPACLPSYHHNLRPPHLKVIWPTIHYNTRKWICSSPVPWNGWSKQQQHTTHHGKWLCVSQSLVLFIWLACRQSHVYYDSPPKTTTTTTPELLISF